MPASFVVTGAGRGVGRAIAVRLLERGDAVVVIDTVEAPDDPAPLCRTVVGDAADPAHRSAARARDRRREPRAGVLAYATAKAAVEGLTRAIAVDYGHLGLRANAVALGTIATERFHDSLTALARDEREGRLRRLGELHPAGRVGTTTDVASVVAFLLSEQSAFVNGAVVPVDGGRLSAGRAACSLCARWRAGGPSRPG